MKHMTKLAISAAGIALVVLAGGFALRYGLAALKAEAAAPVQRLNGVGTTKSLSITPLYENAARDGFTPGHGVAYLIKTDDTTVLLDVGNGGSPDPLALNAKRLDIPLTGFDTLVISHNHPDHMGGNSWWIKSTFGLGGAQPDLAGKRVLTPIALAYPGIEPAVATQPVVLGHGIASLGTLAFIEPPPISLFAPSGAEQVLAVHVDGVGVILISACGHPGLAKMIERAEATFDTPVAGFVGGLHLGAATPDDLQDEIALLAERRPRIVALSPHDSETTAIEAFRAAFGAAYRDVMAGEGIVVGPASALSAAPAN